MTKLDRIILTIIDINQNNSLITKVSTKDIHKFIKDNKLKWLIEDIGRSQKIDLIKSIIKHNLEFKKNLKCEGN